MGLGNFRDQSTLTQTKLLNDFIKYNTNQLTLVNMANLLFGEV